MKQSDGTQSSQKVGKPQKTDDLKSADESTGMLGPNLVANFTPSWILPLHAGQGN